jgi:hypothetical protein
VGENRKFPKAVSVGRNEYPVMKAVRQGLKRVCENLGFANLVPKGRLNLLNLAQDAVLGLDLKGRPSPAGTAENGRRRNPPSAIPAGLNHVAWVPRTSVP